MASERFEMRIDSELLEQLDSWRSKQDGMPSRAEAIRQMIGAQTTVPETLSINLSAGEKLILLTLIDVIEANKLKHNDDLYKLKHAILGGHLWAIGWENQFLSAPEDDPDILRDTVNILDMWVFIEGGFKALNDDAQNRVLEHCHLSGEPAFRGFDYNDSIEAEAAGIAEHLINVMGRFISFKDRRMNSHHPTLQRYRAMERVFSRIRPNLDGRELSADELIEILTSS